MSEEQVKYLSEHVRPKNANIVNISVEFPLRFATMSRRLAQEITFGHEQLARIWVQSDVGQELVSAYQKAVQQAKKRPEPSIDKL